MCNVEASRKLVYVDVIIPVHNAEETITRTVHSAMSQIAPSHLSQHEVDIDLAVCCYDDGSTDRSWSILCGLKEKYDSPSSRYASTEHITPVPDTTKPSTMMRVVNTTLYIETTKEGYARGAGYARNRASSMRLNQCKTELSVDGVCFLCLLDSDDTMHCTRVAEQLHAMLSIPDDDRHRTLLGCTFERDPPDSTWHYAQWANNLTDERLMLERYREITVLQPTWFLSKPRFTELGGYVESPPQRQLESSEEKPCLFKNFTPNDSFRLVHPSYDTSESLRLAEDLRFFHEHLLANGLLYLHRTPTPLVTYRHRAGQSQSSQTPRRLLLQLRVLAFEKTVLRSDPLWHKNNGSFVIWGAGRDGKEFFKALSEDIRSRVACFVDVDKKKIDAGYYANKDVGAKVPIVPFALLATDYATRQRLLSEWEEQDLSSDSPIIGRIDKSRNPGIPGASTVSKKRSHATPSVREKKRRKSHSFSELDVSLLPSLPVVVCVAMYRTQGVLEKNVRSIGRTEGKDLWHFS